MSSPKYKLILQRTKNARNKDVINWYLVNVEIEPFDPARATFRGVEGSVREAINVAKRFVEPKDILYTYMRKS